MEQEVLARQKEVGDVILGGPDSHSASNAEVAQDVEDFWITAKLLQKRNDDLDVLLLHHVQSFRGVIEDTVQNVHHASPLSSQLTEKPVEPLGLGKLGTVGMVASDNGS